MSKGVFSLSRFAGGISDFDKDEQPQDSHAFLLGLNHRKNPRQLTLLPKALKESGTIVTDLPKWAVTPGGVDTNTYFYGSTGNFYKRTSGAVYSLLRTVSGSHGNGLGYFGDDDYIYYTSDTLIGRYGPISVGTAQFVDDFLGSQGGIPLNTNSLDLESSSSQYASRADTATLSITGNLSIEAQLTPESLPTTGNAMVISSKWDESGVLRSYKFEIYAVSGYFGDGSDGSLTISSDTTEAPIDSACTGTVSTNSLSATNASFAAGQVIFIHQTRGSGAGSWMRCKIASYTSGTIVTDTVLNTTYVSGAQVRVLKQYSSVTINSAKVYTAKAWNGTVGGIIGWICSGTTTGTGTVSATGKGFRGGSTTNANTRDGQQGEGTSGAGSNVFDQRGANGNGGGAGTMNSGDTTSTGGGGGGSNGTQGTAGSNVHGTSNYGQPGSTAGSADLTTMVPGGGGGQGGNALGNIGGNGGGIIFISSVAITISGSLISAGNAQTSGGGGNQNGNGGGGAGGSILLKAQSATLGSGLITAPGGAATSDTVGPSGSGGSGRIHLDYLTSYTGTTTPTLDVTQDNSLVTNTTYQLRLHTSSTGSNEDILSKNVSLSTGSWQHVGVSWKASTSTATFFLNAVSQGTSTGSLTAIHDNASTFQIGMSKNGAGSAANFYDGLMDEVRVWSIERTSDDFMAGINTQIATNTTGLNAYYKLNGDYTDATANANNLTSSGSPVFSSTVPFPSPSTRLDIDQQATTSGNTYTTPTSISEASTARLTFTPAKDPQKSIAVLVAAKGTGDWTITVHDEQNRSIITKTITNANMATGYYEFVFDSVWRPKPGVTYHFHLTSTVADGTVTTTTSSDLETVSYRTYFQFLVEDTLYHPITEFLTFLVIGNERYIGTLEAGDWSPNAIPLSAGYKVRCFGYWQEYLVAGTWKGSTVKEYDQGRLYFWDGAETTFNMFIDVPDGAVNAIIGSRGALYVLAGYQGQLLKYVGGTEAQPLIRVPRIEQDEYADIYPQALAMWRNNLRIGVSGASDATNLVKSVYTYGKPTLRYVDSLSADYPISTGNYGTTVNISLLHVVNSTMLIGWQDNISYGVDAVTLSNSPQSFGTIESLVKDNESVWKQKSAQTLVATFKPLLTGESIDIKYKLDRASSWTSLGAVTTVGADEARLVFGGDRWQEIQYAADLYTTGSTSPTLLGLTLELDSQQEERRV